jgi:diaminopimelate epimerase
VTPVRFWKVESVGNHFVLIEGPVTGGADLSEAALRLCAHRTGVGADGLLVAHRLDGAVSLRMFNSDGTEDFCGNGLRCAGLHAYLEGWVGERFAIWHGGRWIPCEVSGDQVAVALPPASFESHDIPSLLPSGERAIVAGLAGIPVSTGSPHFVAIVPELPDDTTFLRVSRAVETASEFPESISVIWTRPDGPRELSLRIWERGVGETFGCGTGSVAAASVWARQTGSTGPILVRNPGGPVRVDVRDDGSVSSTSPSRVFRGEVSLNFWSPPKTAAWLPTSLR